MTTSDSLLFDGLLGKRPQDGACGRVRTRRFTLRDACLSWCEPMSASDAAPKGTLLITPQADVVLDQLRRSVKRTSAQLTVRSDGHELVILSLEPGDLARLDAALRMVISGRPPEDVSVAAAEMVVPQVIASESTSQLTRSLWPR
jgi:hypothetical protein